MTETEYHDFPKAELIAGADKELRKLAADGLTAHAYFKASCPKCGERCAFDDPDVIYERMDCCACGHSFPFVAGNYYLLVSIGDVPPTTGGQR